MKSTQGVRHQKGEAEGPLLRTGGLGRKIPRHNGEGLETRGTPTAWVPSRAEIHTVTLRRSTVL